MPPAVLLAVADALEDLLLGFLPEAVERGDLAVETGLLERGDGIDTELLTQCPDLFRAHARNLQDLDQARGDRRLQLRIKA